jgi:hypothetical protein
MAYSPLGGASTSLLRDPTLARIGAAHGCSAAAVALAWAIRSGKVIAIPESGARKGERGRVLIGTDITGASSPGCSASAAQPLALRRQDPLPSADREVYRTLMSLEVSNANVPRVQTKRTSDSV